MQFFTLVKKKIQKYEKNIVFILVIEEKYHEIESKFCVILM